MGAAARRSSAGSTVTYTSALHGVDVSYAALATGLKDTLVLRDASAASSFTYRVTLPAGSTLARDPTSGGVTVTDAAGRPSALRLAPPAVAYSVPGSVPSGRPVTMTVGGTAAAPTVTVGVEPAWLAVPGRVFPVPVDPATVSAWKATYLGGRDQGDDELLGERDAPVRRAKTSYGRSKTFVAPLMFGEV